MPQPRTWSDPFRAWVERVTSALLGVVLCRRLQPVSPDFAAESAHLARNLLAALSGSMQGIGFASLQSAW